MRFTTATVMRFFFISLSFCWYVFPEFSTTYTHTPPLGLWHLDFPPWLFHSPAGSRGSEFPIEQVAPVIDTPERALWDFEIHIFALLYFVSKLPGNCCRLGCLAAIFYYCFPVNRGRLYYCTLLLMTCRGSRSWLFARFLRPSEGCPCIFRVYYDAAAD